MLNQTMKSLKYISILCVIITVSCHDRPNLVFKSSELSDQTGIEIHLIEKLEKLSGQKSKHLTTYFSPLIYTSNPEIYQVYPDDKSVKIPGVSVVIDNREKALEIIQLLRPVVHKQECEIFISEENISDKRIELSIVRNRDKFDVLKWVQTNGINFQISNDSIIQLIKLLDQKLDLEIIGADFDWCEFQITNTDQEWNVLANSVYEISPDIVEQGAGSIDALAQEMKETQSLYLWWD